MKVRKLETQATHKETELLADHSDSHSISKSSIRRWVDASQKRILQMPAVAAIAFAGALCQSQATVVVSWGGDMVPDGATAQFVLPTAVTNGAVRTWPYSFTNAISPTSNYTGPAFYGVLQNVSGTGTAAPLGSSRITGGASGLPDELRIWGSGNVTSSQTTTVSALIFFKPNVSLDETVSFTVGNSAITMDVRHPSASSSSNRVAVLNGGIWYLSQTVTNTLLPDASLELWGAWDPTGAPLASVPTTFDTLGSTFTNIEGIGFFSTASRTDTNGPRINAYSFTANATVVAVPEPQTVTMLIVSLLGGGLMILRSRRHRA